MTICEQKITVWKDGRRHVATELEFADQLERFASLAEKKWSISSGWEAHLGERLRMAAAIIRGHGEEGDSK